MCEAHLKLSLREPVGKVEGDAVERWARFRNASTTASVVGFTLNVNRKPKLDYVAIAESASKTRVVHYRRSNRVKAAVSRVRGKLLDSVCGYNNIRTGARAGEAVGCRCLLSSMRTGVSSARVEERTHEW